MIFTVVNESADLMNIAVDLKAVRQQSGELGVFPEFMIEREFLELFKFIKSRWGELYTQSSAFTSLQASIGEFIKNALDAEAARFFIHFTCPDHRVSITLLNDGKPIKEALCGVFASSMVLESEKKLSGLTYGGAGLGLKISALIVESTGGILTLANLAIPQQECTCCIRLESSQEKSLIDEVEAKELIERKGKRCSAKDLLALRHEKFGFFSCAMPHSEACADEKEGAKSITLSIMRGRRSR